MVGYLGAFVSKNGNIREIICPVVEEREDRVLQKRCQLCDFQRFLKCELTGQKIAIREFCPLVIDTIKCCIKLVIDTFYSPCLSCILLRS